MLETDSADPSVLTKMYGFDLKSPQSILVALRPQFDLNEAAMPCDVFAEDGVQERGDRDLARYRFHARRPGTGLIQVVRPFAPA